MVWTEILKIIWKYKIPILILCIIITTGIYIVYLRASLNTKTSELNTKNAQIEIFQRQNQILQQNAIAIQKQDKLLKQIQSDVAPLQRMVTQIPKESKRVLNEDKDITMFNDCIVDFFNSGMLSEGCDAVKTVVSETK